MKRWEYKTIAFIYNRYSDFDRRINEEGKKGWELCYANKGDDIKRFTIIFKREISSKAKST